MVFIDAGPGAGAASGAGPDPVDCWGRSSGCAGGCRCSSRRGQWAEGLSVALARSWRRLRLSAQLTASGFPVHLGVTRQIGIFISSWPAAARRRRLSLLWRRWWRLALAEPQPLAATFGARLSVRRSLAQCLTSWGAVRGFFRSRRLWWWAPTISCFLAGSLAGPRGAFLALALGLAGLCPAPRPRVAAVAVAAFAALGFGGAVGCGFFSGEVCWQLGVSPPCWRVSLFLTSSWLGLPSAGAQPGAEPLGFSGGGSRGGPVSSGLALCLAEASVFVAAAAYGFQG